MQAASRELHYDVSTQEPFPSRPAMCLLLACVAKLGVYRLVNGPGVDSIRPGSKSGISSCRSKREFSYPLGIHAPTCSGKDWPLPLPAAIADSARLRPHHNLLFLSSFFCCLTVATILVVCPLSVRSISGLWVPCGRLSAVQSRVCYVTLLALLWGFPIRDAQSTYFSISHLSC